MLKPANVGVVNGSILSPHSIVALGGGSMVKVSRNGKSSFVIVSGVPSSTSTPNERGPTAPSASFARTANTLRPPITIFSFGML